MGAKGHVSTARFLPLVLSLLTGCGDPPHMQEMAKKPWVPELVSTPEIEQVWVWNSPEENRPGMSHMFFMSEIDSREIEARQTNAPVNLDLKFLVKLVKDAGFQARLKVLQETSFPAKYDSPQRQEARKNYFQEWSNLLKILENKGKLSEIKQAVANLTRYMAQMRYVPDQTVPAGNDAKRYSTITTYEDPYK